MSPGRRLLLVLVCVLGVVVVAATFPAADPRLDPPETASGVSGGDWDNVTGSSERSNGDTIDEEQRSNEQSANPQDGGFWPFVEGTVVPGTTAQAGVDDGDFFGSSHDSVTMLVNGETVGTVGPDRNTEFRVPTGTDEITVTVEETGDSVTVPVETNITVSSEGAFAPNSEVQITGDIGNYTVDNATVSVDGEPVATTGEDGKADVTLPESAGETEIRLTRGALTGSLTATVAEPEVGFSSPVIFPGLPTHLSVTADGGGVDNATVVVGDSETTTNRGGSAWVNIPLADEVTVTATVGEEQATTTVSNLYLRTTLVVLVGPGLIIGAVWTYLRYIAARRREGFGAAVLGIAALLGGLSAAVFRYGSLSLQGIRSLRLPSLPSASFPTMSLPSLGNLFSLGLPSLRKLGDTLRMPRRSGDNTVAGAVTDGEESTTGEETVDERATASAVAGPQATVRDAWHTFLDQLQIQDIETATPGEAARVALAAGYPAEQVRRLLSLFRDVEYGDSDPSTDDVADAQATVDTLTNYHPDEEEPQ